MRSYRVRVMVEIALAVALAATLNLFHVRLPINIAGGSISLDMVPIFVVALRLGLIPGLITGGLWGLFDLLFQPYVVHPVQLVLDYPLAFALCGLAGLGAVHVQRTMKAGRLGPATALAVLWVLLGGLGRFASHLVSGAVFFGANAPAGQPVWVYSALYNISYLAPSIIGAVIVVPILLMALTKAAPAPIKSTEGNEA